MSGQAATRSHPRGLAVAVLGGLAGGGLALLGASRPWARSDVVAEGVPSITVDVLGTDAVPVVAAAALVVVTGSLALLPTGGMLRRLVGGLVALAALGVLVGALLASPAVTDALARELLATASTGDAEAAELAARADLTWWRWLSVVGGLAGAAVGLWAVLRAHTWTVMGSRYEAPATGAAKAARSDASSEHDVDPWRAMDDGRDPTL